MPNIPPAAAIRPLDTARGTPARVPPDPVLRAGSAAPEPSGLGSGNIAPGVARRVETESAERPRKRLRLNSPDGPFAAAGTHMAGTGSYRRHGVFVAHGKRTEPLQQHQINEAGYLTARASLGRPIDEAAGDLRRVIDGNETVHQTRMLLSGGRGNVDEDDILTGGTSRQRVDAARKVARSRADIAADVAADLGPPLDKEQKDAIYLDTIAAASVALAAGNCGESSAVAARLHASKLQGQETVSHISSTSFDHAWVEIETLQRPGVVLDPWANGPAMEKGDTAWRTSGPQVADPGRPAAPDTGAAPVTVGSTTRLQTFRAGTAARATLLEEAEYLARGPGRPSLDAALQATPKLSPGNSGFTHSPSLAGSLDPGLPSFGEKARVSLQGQAPLHQEILAVGAMRQGYRANIAMAAAQAQSVLEAARTLDTMPAEKARPPLREPRPDLPPQVAHGSTALSPT